MRARARTGLFLLIGALFIVSVPWYRETGAPVEIVWGLPDWVAWALGCYVGVAILNAIAWLITETPDEATSAGREGEAP
jgi:hypothetical protein